MGLLITVPYSSIPVWFILAGRFGKVSEKKLYTRVPLHKNRMQLPVGNILEIKTSERISSILNSIKHTKFSGICHISSNTVSGTLVFESGECILAQIGDKSGNEALEDLLKISHYNVDAAFLDMDKHRFSGHSDLTRYTVLLKAQIRLILPHTIHRDQHPPLMKPPKFQFTSFRNWKNSKKQKISHRIWAVLKRILTLLTRSTLSL